MTPKAPGLTLGLLLFFTVAALSAETLPLILILHTDEVGEDLMASIRSDLESQLLAVGLETAVTVRRVSGGGRRPAAWQRAAAESGAPPGTVAVMGLECDEARCVVMILSESPGCGVSLPVPQPAQPTNRRVEAVAATLREAVLGPLLPELDRLIQQGMHPTPPPSAQDAVLLKSPFDSERSALPANEQWMWVSAGYHGDHPYPKGYPIHGPVVGLDVIPARMLGLGLSVGWLGVRRGAVAHASASVHRLDTALALRLLFPIGPARISVSAVGRLDSEFVRTTNSDRSEDGEVRLVAQTGGVTMWHLPISRRLQVWVGAGVLVSLNSRAVDLRLDSGRSERLVSSTTVRITWCAKVAFSPMR